MISTLKNQKLLIVLFLICSFPVGTPAKSFDAKNDLSPEKIQPEVFNAEKYRQFYQNHFNSSCYGNNFSKEARLAGLSRAWAEARWNFGNFDLVPELNWDSLYFSFIPKVENATSPTEYYKLLMNFYSHLRDGHCMIFMPDNLKDSLIADLPIRCRLIENRVFGCL